MSAVTRGAPAAAAMQEADRLVREQFAVIETGRLDLAESNVTADFFNHRSDHEPLAARGRGPDALKATATWLRRAFQDIRFEVHEIALVEDRAIAWVTMHATQGGPFVVHDSPDGSVTEAFPATGGQFASRQVHWFRIVDGRIAEHDAVRDDLEMAKQVGWIPPRPELLVRMLLLRRRERRATGRERDGAQSAERTRPGSLMGANP